MTIALLFFTTNEVVKLFDQIRIINTTRRIRKLISKRTSTVIPNDPTSEPSLNDLAATRKGEKPVWKAKATIEEASTERARILTQWPVPTFSFNFKFNWLAIISVNMLLIFGGLAYYILFVYTP
jgi:hypothetical protein